MPRNGRGKLFRVGSRVVAVLAAGMLSMGLLTQDAQAVGHACQSNVNGQCFCAVLGACTWASCLDGGYGDACT